MFNEIIVNICNKLYIKMLDLQTIIIINMSPRNIFRIKDTTT